MLARKRAVIRQHNNTSPGSSKASIVLRHHGCAQDRRSPRCSCNVTFPRAYLEVIADEMMNPTPTTSMTETPKDSVLAKALGETGKSTTPSHCWVFPARRHFVLLLGIGRMVIIKVLNYQEHISEYGVHWNFFVTLFCLWVVTADILHEIVLPRRYLAAVAVGILTLYQYALLSTIFIIFIGSNALCDSWYDDDIVVCWLVCGRPAWIISTL